MAFAMTRTMSRITSLRPALIRVNSTMAAPRFKSNPVIQSALPAYQQQVKVYKTSKFGMAKHPYSTANSDEHSKATNAVNKIDRLVCALVQDNYSEVAEAFKELLPSFEQIEHYLKMFGGTTIASTLRALGARVKGLPEDIGQQLYDFLEKHGKLRILAWLRKKSGKELPKADQQAKGQPKDDQQGKEADQQANEQPKADQQGKEADQQAKEQPRDDQQAKEQPKDDQQAKEQPKADQKAKEQGKFPGIYVDQRRFMFIVNNTGTVSGDSTAFGKKP